MKQKMKRGGSDTDAADIKLSDIEAPDGVAKMKEATAAAAKERARVKQAYEEQRHSTRRSCCGCCS